MIYILSGKQLYMIKLTHTFFAVACAILSYSFSLAADLTNCDAYITAIADCRIEVLSKSTKNNTINFGQWTTNGIKKDIVRYFYKSQTPNEWTTTSFKIKALQTGKLTLGAYMQEKKDESKNILPIAVYYDDFKVNGKLIPNGDFQKDFDGWWYNKHNKNFPPKIIKKLSITGGGNCARVTRQSNISQSIKIEAGKTYEVSFRTRRAGLLKVGCDDMQFDISKEFNCDENIAKKFGSKLQKMDLTGNGMYVYNIRFASKSIDGKTAYVPRNRLTPQAKGSAELDVSADEATARYLYILHTAFNAFESKYNAIGRMVFTLDNGQQIKHDIHLGRDVWWSDSEKLLRNGKAIKTKNGYLYFSRFELPENGVVKKIAFQGFYKVPWAIYAATFSDTKEYAFQFTHDIDNWSGADIPENLDIAKGSALDLSHTINTPIPAGASGRAFVSERGTIAFENTPNIDARFKSYSLWSSSLMARLPATEKYEKMRKYASRLRAQGYNCVRIKLDYLKSFSTRKEREELYDSVDFLFSELKKNGVYFQIIFGTYDDGREGYKFGGHNDIKMLAIIGDAETWRRWKEDAERMLNHVNPYTGLAWKDDPAMLSVEYYNELTNSMGRLSILTPKVRKMAEDKFIQFLKNKYKNIDELNKAWNDGKFWKKPFNFTRFEDAVKPFVYPRNPDWQEFGWVNITKFGEFAEKVVVDTGYKGLISECNTGTSSLGKQYCNHFTDVVIKNTYYSHPSGFGARDITCNQKSALSSFWINGIASCRLNNRPTSVTEYNYCHWNPYRYEACVLVAPYCAFQNFSVMTIHQDVIRMSDSVKIPSIGTFSVGSSPVMRASELMMSCFFMRGDVKPSSHRVDMDISEDYLKTFASRNAQNIEQTKVALLSGYASKFDKMDYRGELKKVKTKPADIEMSPIGSSEIRQEEWFQEVIKDGKASQFDLAKFVEKMREKNILSPTNKTDIKNGIFQTDTEQITLDSQNLTMKVTTDFSQAVAMEKSQEVDLGALKAISTSVPATIGVCSLDGKKISESERLVFIYATGEKNLDMKTSFDNEYCVYMGRGPVGIRNGKVKAELKVNPNKKYVLYPLALNGARREKLEMPVENGVMKISIDNSKLKNGSTTMFEIVAHE